MNRFLSFIRHAEAGRSPDGDFSRALTARGVRDARNAALHLKRLAPQVPIPAQILSSPARRAVETANELLRELALNPSSLVLDNTLYFANSIPEMYLRIVCLSDPIDHLILCGHNPLISALADAFCFETAPLMPTASVLTLSRDSDSEQYHLFSFYDPHIPSPES